MSEEFEYRADIVDRLLAHGVRPRPTTRPELVKEFVSDLYRHELRRLRASLRRREFAKSELAARVIELRRRYPLVSLPIEEWARRR